MMWAAIIFIWAVVAILVALAFGRMCAINPRDDKPDPEPDWSADDPRITELSENIRRARARHSARAHWTREARAIRTERLRQQFQRRRA